MELPKCRRLLRPDRIATFRLPRPASGGDVAGEQRCYSCRRDGVKQRPGHERNMISETTTALAPEQVLLEARRFFTDEDSISAATIVDESDRHLTLATFRSRIAISAWSDEGETTRVRVSTLRGQDAVGRFLSMIRSAGRSE